MSSISNSRHNLNLFVENFEKVRDMGFVKSHRAHNTGIGKTLEDLMGIEENNDAIPDFGDIEIKAQRKMAGSYVTLFTKSPSHPKSANSILRDNFGEENEDNPELKKLHVSMFSSHYSNTYGKWGFRLRPSDSENKLFIDVKDLNTDKRKDISAYYDYAVLKDIIFKKLNILAFVSTESKMVNGKEHFHFTDCTVYHECDFQNFISLIEQDKIMYDIRIGSYKSGSMYGKVHDHGSGFRVKRDNFNDVFSDVINVI